MTPRPRLRSEMVTRLLLILCLLLGPLIYMEFELQEADAPEIVAASEAPPAAPKPAPEPQDTAFAMLPIDSYSEVLARPPFSETRRPAPPGTVAKASDQPLTMTVIGTILAAGSVRALVAHGEPPQVTRVTEGQEIDGWTVKAILQEKVVLVRSGTTVELKVKSNGPAIPPTSAAPSPAAPSPTATAQRLTRAGAFGSPPPPQNNTASRRPPQPGTTAALAEAQGDAPPPQAVNSDLLPPTIRGSGRGGVGAASIKRGR